MIVTIFLLDFLRSIFEKYSRDPTVQVVSCKIYGEYILHCFLILKKKKQLAIVLYANSTVKQTFKGVVYCLELVVLKFKKSHTFIDFIEIYLIFCLAE